MKLAKLEVPPQGWLGSIGDFLMTPIMYLGSGTLREVPQRTHFWNNKKLSSQETEHLFPEMMVPCEARSDVIPMGLARFHLPILGGWRDYVVLEPYEPWPWYVGWKSPEAVGVSRIRLDGPVRLLLGPAPVSFFGINWENIQIPIQKIGEGRVGDSGPFRNLPLL